METRNKRIVKIMAEQMGMNESEFIPSAELAGDLYLDSLDYIECTMALEDEFGLEIPDSELESVVTMQDVFDLVNKCLQSAARV